MLTVPDLRAVLAACVRGIGITVLPRYLCDGFLAANELHAPDKAPVNRLSLAWKTGVGNHERIACTRRLLLDAARRW